MQVFKTDMVNLFLADALDLYPVLPPPVVIVSDGPYGLGSFPGDPPTPDALAEWYRPHVEQWSARATPQTTLWFWNSELGWAKVHHLFEEFGWEYRSCHIWDKGMAHVAGNCNGSTLRKLPVTTEVCVQYTKKAFFKSQGTLLPMKEWLRAEWERTGLPFHKTNDACGVRNAATRKYFTRDHLWYYPPPEAFEQIAEYANRHGKPEGRPYFSQDGKCPMTGCQWAKMRAKFHFENGLTNVWPEPAVRGQERLKSRSKCVHMNQKPLRLIELCLRVSSDPGDVVWEPFGGLCTTGVACRHLGRQCYVTEINPDYYRAAIDRLEHPNALFNSNPSPVPHRASQGVGTLLAL
jgi:site-specific DNA-methyltransferase (adenine-specific)